MSKLHRLAFRLRQEALRWYEILLCAMLLALALSLVAPSAAQGDDDRVACRTVPAAAP